MVLANIYLRPRRPWKDSMQTQVMARPTKERHVNKPRLVNLFLGITEKTQTEHKM